MFGGQIKGLKTAIDMIIALGVNPYPARPVYIWF